MRQAFFIFAFSLALVFSGCGSSESNSGPAKPNQPVIGAVNAPSPPVETPPEVQNVAPGERPQKIKDLMTARGEQDTAAPAIKIIEPNADAVLASSTVKVQIQLSGDLKGYMPGMDEATHTGNHIHVILDNQPYEAYYNTNEPFELRNVVDGDHILRVFPSRPWHESYKNAGAFQVIKFSVKNGGADPNKPTTTPDGQTVAQGKDVLPSTAGAVDPKKPLLTYSRPKGEYKGADAEAIMIDFWLTNAKLVGDGGTYRVRYSINGKEAGYLDKWQPIWLTGWIAGKPSVKLELVDKGGNLVDNAGYNSTTREITITK